MPRIADALERESRTVDLEQGDFERLLGRRERKQRNQRMRSGALGIIVALAAGIVLVRALTSNSIPANRPVQPTPASGALAYALDGDIWVAEPDGSNPVAITDAASDDRCPAGPRGYSVPSWSPDGRYLAFRRAACPGVEPDRDVVIMDLHGNVVANFPAQGGGIAWSPDSTRVAVWDENSYGKAGVGTFTVGIYGIDGTREIQIPMPAGWEPTDDRDPIWTPDGASLIVNELEVPLDGGTPRELPFPEAFRTRPEAFRTRLGGVWVPALAYSTDGTQVAYGTRDALMVARADGSEPREVLGDVAITATWSPTGELIAVAAHPPGGGTAPNGAPTPNQLRLLDVTTGSSTLLFEDEPGTWLEVLGFSPRGDRVLFSEQRPVSGQPGTYLYSLWSVGVDGSDATPIVPASLDGAWRPI
jgi:Tol biopolymer transport system component